MDIRVSTLARFLDFRSMEWRHHGLGMLQGEIDETLRVHLWDPRLRTIPLEGFRMVHDHRFDLTSVVLRGVILDVSYHVQWPFGFGWVPNTKCWEIRHAKIQATFDTMEKAADQAAVAASGDVHLVGEVNAYVRSVVAHASGEQYMVARREFHTTRVEAPTITLVRRSNFDERPARVLGEKAHSAIVRYRNDDTSREAIAHAVLVREVVEEAQTWLEGQR